MQNSMVAFTFSNLNQEYPLWTILVEEIKIVGLSWKLVLHFDVHFFCFRLENQNCFLKLKFRTYSHVHNTLRPFDGWPDFPFITSETEYSPRNENFVSNSKNLLKNRNWTFPVVRHFTCKLQFVSNISWMIIAGNSFLFLTQTRPLQTLFAW